MSSSINNSRDNFNIRSHYLNICSNTLNIRSDALNILQLNVQSLRNKMLLLETILKDKMLDILCISEHWLKLAETEFYVPFNFVLGSVSCRKKILLSPI